MQSQHFQQIGSITTKQILPYIQRPLATTIGATATPLGSGLGFIWPVFFINQDDAKADREKGKDQVEFSVLIYAIAISAILLLCLLIIREKPKTPPWQGSTQSYSATHSKTEEKTSMLKGLKVMAQAKGFYLLGLSFCLTVLIMATLAGQVNAILAPFGMTAVSIHNVQHVGGMLHPGSWRHFVWNIRFGCPQHICGNN
eukprot:TRINITY_DN183_c0_g1_i11.p1 TRINITY_DN183_c0_g1~~TRINITY_DN183_c0_g1_i11.p1  ORF type:complete len:199 (-),score=16.28 TRINITY_DN183_c0_g1_i11:283-879(-)